MSSGNGLIMLCGKAASGLYGVLVRETPGKHGYVLWLKRYHQHNMENYFLKTLYNHLIHRVIVTSDS